MDMMTVDTGFEMIANWAAQGLIRALPDNWKEAYPNIYAYMDNAGLVDLLTQPDGKVYCVPKAIYSHFTAGIRICGIIRCFIGRTGRRTWVSPLVTRSQFLN